MGSEGSHNRTSTLATRNRITGGVMAVVGIYIIVEALDYGLGTPSRMGPGFLPLGLGVLIILFGGLIAFLSGDGHEASDRIVWRPVVLVLAAILAFALLIEPAGLVVATAALVFISGVSDPEHTWRSLAGLYIFLVVSVYVVFVQLLSIPFKLITGVV